jgi:hypothetical protein
MPACDELVGTAGQMDYRAPAALTPLITLIELLTLIRTMPTEDIASEEFHQI